jgi:hypothetical protein
VPETGVRLSALNDRHGRDGGFPLPGPSEHSPRDQTPWLLAIGEWLRSECDSLDSLAEPLPERLTALIAQLETLGRATNVEDGD